MSLRSGEAELLADRIVLTGTNTTLIVTAEATPSHLRATLDRTKAQERKGAASTDTVSTGLAPVAKPSRQQELLQEELKLIEQEIKAVEKLVQSGRSLPNDLLALRRARLQLHQNLLLAFDPSPANLSRRKESLAAETQLVEQQLADQKKRVDAGTASRESLLSLQREHLKLQRELAALEENPSSRQTPASAPTPNSANKQALLKEEIKLVEQQLAEHKELTEKKLASQSSLIAVQRELLKLKRELADAEAEAAYAANASAVFEARNVRNTVPDRTSSAAKFSTRRDAGAGQIQPHSGEQLQAGILEEELNLDLNAAIQSYQALVTQFDGQRPLVANTVFRLGECYRKLGRMNEAKAQYGRVLREFSDQALLVNLCQKYLSSAPLPGAVSSGAILPVDVFDEEQRINQQLAEAKADVAKYEKQLRDVNGEIAMIGGKVKEDCPNFPDEAISDPQFKRLKSNYENAVLNSSRPDYRDITPAEARKQIEQWLTEVHLPRLNGKREYAASRYPEATNEVARLEARFRTIRQQATTGRGAGAGRFGSTAPSPVSEIGEALPPIRDVRAQWELDLAHAQSCLQRVTNEAARIAWEMRTVKQTDVLSLPTLADETHQRQMDRFKSEYERALRPAVNPPGGTNRSGRVRVQKGDVVRQMETWVKEIYLPEQEVNLRLATRQAGRWSNEIQRAETAIQAYLKHHPAAPSTHRPGANPPEVEDLLQHMERARTEGINHLRRMVEEEAILAVATNSPPEALSQKILGKWYWDYKQPDLHIVSQSSPQKFESIKTNMAAWLKDDFLPEKERSLRELQGDYARMTNEVRKLESNLGTLRAEGGGSSQREKESAAMSGRDAQEWQLALARDQELDAKREVATYEVALACRAKAQERPGSAGETGEADKETERIKKDLANAKSEAVSLSERVARLDEMLKQPGSPSRATVAVPLATQLSEAVRAETESRKYVADLESLLVHAEEWLKAAPDSEKAQYEAGLAKEDLAIAKMRQTLWADQVKRLRARRDRPQEPPLAPVGAHKPGGLSQRDEEPAAMSDRATLEWQLAQARKEEIEAKRELANGESLLSNMENQLKLENQFKANPQSEQAKIELLRARIDLQAAKEQYLLWSTAVARLEARLKEQTSASPDTLTTTVFALKYAQAAEAAASLQPLLSPEFRIVADTRSNTLVVHGPDKRLATLTEVIRKLDSITTNATSSGKKF